MSAQSGMSKRLVIPQKLIAMIEKKIGVWKAWFTLRHKHNHKQHKDKHIHKKKESFPFSYAYSFVAKISV